MNVQNISEKIYQRMLEKGLVMIEISARHIHLTQDDVDQLFGKGYQLSYVRELSQKGQYLCKERVDVTGPKGTIRNVAILGPCRSLSQVELAKSEARKIGIDAPFRISGDTVGSPGATISVADKSIEIKDGVIVAKRHIHMTPTDAQRLNLVQGEKVNVKVFGDERSIIFEDAIIRIDDNATLAMHIDIEEANAAGISKLGYGIIQKVN